MTGVTDEIFRDKLTESFGGPVPDLVTHKTAVNKALNPYVIIGLSPSLSSRRVHFYLLGASGVIFHPYIISQKKIPEN